MKKCLLSMSWGLSTRSKEEVISVHFIRRPGVCMDLIFFLCFLEGNHSHCLFHHLSCIHLGVLLGNDLLKIQCMLLSAILFNKLF